MNSLIFGAGSIYQEFYSPILDALGFNKFVIDPRISNKDQIPNIKYNIVLILSPPQIHFHNISYISKAGITWDKMIIEKPALVSTNQYSEVLSLFNDIKIKDIFTVTPRRLSLAFLALKQNQGLIKTVNLRYGVQSKWLQNSISHMKYNSCAFDLGTHFIDAINFALSTNNNDLVVVNAKSLQFNLLDIEYRINSTKVTICISRENYLVNYISIKYDDGRKLILPLDVNDTFYANGIVCNPDLNSTDAITEFSNLLEEKESNLFSPFLQFKPTISLLDSIYD